MTAHRLSIALADRYRVERELGAGGMATVYLAHDVKHDRDVAIKVLHPDLGAALGGERFLAEIRTTAKLQHPHILPLLDSGEAGDGLLYYVMPFVRGETLRARLERERQLPVDDAVRIMREVAEALQHAHAQGIVHRDVKPENILLQDDHALVADFGIALAVQQAGTARLTQTGLSLGTPSYMSPEQAMGERSIDARSDQYALGAMAYEMLSGEPPFTGPTAQAIAARIVHELPRSLVPGRPAVPAALDATIRRALEKLPADRFASMGAFVAALDDRLDANATRGRAGIVETASVRTRHVTQAAAILGIAATGIAAWSLTRPAPLPPVVRYRLVADSVSAQRTWTGDVSISPDGALIIRRGGPGDRLLARRRDALDFTPIAGTEGALAATFSPDGSRLAFYQDGRLVVMPTEGGPPTVIADSLPSWESVAWGPNDLIYRVMSQRGGTVLGRCPVSDCRRLEAFSALDTTAGEVNHLHAEPLPDGRAVVFTAEFNDGSRRLVFQRTTERTHTVITDGVRARYVPSGHLVYSTADARLWVAAFDTKSARITGTPRLVAENLPTSVIGAVDFAVSSSGTLVYSEERSGDRRELVWVSRDGQQSPFASGWRAAFSAPALSPDGRQVAVAVRDGARSSIWLHPTSGGAPTLLTADRSASEPAWSTDGRMVTFLAGGNRTNTGNLWAQPVDGLGTARLLVSSARPLSEQAWLPDGRGIVVRTTTGTTGAGDLLIARTRSDTLGVPLLATPRSEWSPAVSPDGRWLAYASNLSGRVEVYVSPLGSPESARVIVSSGGGNAPRWSADGRALFFLSSSSQLMEARLSAAGPLRVESVRPLFDARGLLQTAISRRNFDVAPDGRFLFVRRAEDTPAGAMVVIENWVRELSRMPTR